MKRLYFLLLAISLFQLSCKDTPESDNINASDTEAELTDGADGHEDIMEVNDTTDIHDITKKSIMSQKKELEEKGYQVFEMVDEKSGDTILMQQYFMAFLKSGPIRNQNEEEAKRLQEEHLAHLAKMYQMGYADISGPFGDDGEVRGITVYNTPTLEMADSLANADPAVKAQRLVIEIRPWWGMKNSKLR